MNKTECPYLNKSGFLKLCTVCTRSWFSHGTRRGSGYSSLYSCGKFTSVCVNTVCKQSCLYRVRVRVFFYIRRTQICVFLRKKIKCNSYEDFTLLIFLSCMSDQTDVSLRLIRLLEDFTLIFYLGCQTNHMCPSGLSDEWCPIKPPV